jgi:hypothetical protein
VFDVEDVKQVEWVRTSGSDIDDECADFDGQTIQYSEVEDPPIHPRCQCVLIPR